MNLLTPNPNSSIMPRASINLLRPQSETTTTGPTKVCRGSAKGEKTRLANCQFDRFSRIVRVDIIGRKSRYNFISTKTPEPAPSLSFCVFSHALLGGIRPPSAPQRPSHPLLGHWTEQRESAPVTHWHFRTDGTFESVKISYDSHGLNKIFDIRVGGFHFSRSTYSLAYIQKYHDEPTTRYANSDITFTGPTPVIEKGTFELRDQQLVLINRAGKKRTLIKCPTTN